MDEAKGFFTSLFDFSFSSFITGRIIRFLYGLSVAISAIVALVAVVSSFMMSSVAGVLMLLIGAPVLFLVSVIYARVMLEIIMVIFSISGNVSRLASDKSHRTGG